MPPVIPNPNSIHAFDSAAEFDRWLRANHAIVAEIWIKIHKKASGLPTVTYAEALDSALCYGWIDGLKKSWDDQSFIQRFTPRTKTSIWSQANTEHVARLSNAGRMQPEGQKQIDLAKADGRWDRAYARGRDMQIPDDLQKAIDANKNAKKTFDIVNKLNRFAMAFRIGNTRKPEVRAERIASYVQMLARGETLTDNGRKNPTKMYSAKNSKETSPAVTTPSGKVATKSTAKTAKTTIKVTKKVAKKVAKKTAAKKSAPGKSSTTKPKSR
ncbi:MAG: YdeI/OmpD-associated family protein [Gemmatimonadaceae bacterium]